MPPIQRPVYYVFLGEAIPDLALFLKVDGRLLTGNEYSYSMTVFAPNDESTVLFTKTTGFTGQVGSGTGLGASDVPNVIVSWDPPAETSLLTIGASHLALLTYFRLSDSKPGYYKFIIRAE